MMLTLRRCVPKDPISKTNQIHPRKNRNEKRARVAVGLGDFMEKDERILVACSTLLPYQVLVCSTPHCVCLIYLLPVYVLEVGSISEQARALQVTIKRKRRRGSYCLRALN